MTGLESTQRLAILLRDYNAHPGSLTAYRDSSDSFLDSSRHNGGHILVSLLSSGSIDTIVLEQGDR